MEQGGGGGGCGGQAAAVATSERSGDGTWGIDVGGVCDINTVGGVCGVTSPSLMIFYKN